MLVLSVEEMREFEEHTLSMLKMTEIELMNTAGVALANDFLARVQPKKDSSIGVVAGIGNNGGDALVMAITLQKLGFKPKIFVVGELPTARDAFLHYFDLAGTVISITNKEELEVHQVDIMKSEYILDGLFGIGLSREVTGFYSDLIDYINASKCVVYSVDIPSGIHPKNGLLFGNAVHANYTGVVGYLKLGNLMSDALDYHGEIQVLQIGIAQKYPIKKEFIECNVREIRKPLRKHNSNKYSNGLGVFIGGRQSMMGSIQMSAISAMKCGLGISVILSDLKDHNYTQFYPELIIQNHVGDEARQLLDKAKVVVFGPGLGVHNDDYQKLLDYLLETDIPLLVDASGFTYLDIHKTYHNQHVLLTPHIGELAKMFNISSEEVRLDPFKYVNMLSENGFNVALKGPCTVVTSKGKTGFIQAKNPGLATAGTGDVLSGIIAAFLSREEAFDAMSSGVITHALAADYVSKELGEISLMASDLISSIYKVLK